MNQMKQGLPVSKDSLVLERKHSKFTTSELFFCRKYVIEFNVQANQKRLVDDTERRLNVLFDGLNCETVPASVIDELMDIVKGLSSFRAVQTPPFTITTSGKLVLTFQFI